MNVLVVDFDETHSRPARRTFLLGRSPASTEKQVRQGAVTSKRFSNRWEPENRLQKFLVSVYVRFCRCTAEPSTIHPPLASLTRQPERDDDDGDDDDDVPLFRCLLAQECGTQTGRQLR